MVKWIVTPKATLLSAKLLNPGHKLNVIFHLNQICHERFQAGFMIRKISVDRVTRKTQDLHLIKTEVGWSSFGVWSFCISLLIIYLLGIIFHQIEMYGFLSFGSSSQPICKILVFVEMLNMNYSLSTNKATHCDRPFDNATKYQKNENLHMNLLFLNCTAWLLLTKRFT